jgi:RHS repeat-associated protein
MWVGSTLYWLLTDHLGPAAITAYSSGRRKAELRYKAWGETRYTYGTTPTAYKFTGQRLDESTGLYYYGARYYDAALGRFVQADTIVPEPGNPQDLNRYSYVRNNPLRYIDPTGHWLFEKTPDDPRLTPPGYGLPAMHSVSPPPQPLPIEPALEVLAQTPTGQRLAYFARTHDLTVWFGVGPFDAGDRAGNLTGGWLILPKSYQDPTEMSRPEAVALIAHELVHVMQRQQSRMAPFWGNLYSEVEASTVQNVILWEIGEAIGGRQGRRLKQQAGKG